MSWLLLAGVNIISLSIYSLLTKLLADRTAVSFRMFAFYLIGLVLAVVLLVVDLKSGRRFSWTAHEAWLVYLMAAASAIAVLAFQAMFTQGAPLSVATLLTRVGVVVIMAVLGVLLFKENADLKFILGLLFSVAGLFLLLS